MNEKTVTDKLTGTYNKRYIRDRLPIDQNYCNINNLQLSIIMTEIDYLDYIKEEYGQGALEKALLVFSKIMKESIRSNTDWIGRYSTRKFIIVLGDTDVNSACTMAEKIRRQVESTSFNYKDVGIRVTSSFGVYGVNDHNIDFSELLSKVRRNLQKAVISGGNRTISNLRKVYGVSLSKNSENNIKLMMLDKQINELREVLNEVCFTLEDDESKPKRLVISQRMDELIVEYMKEINNIK
ncbi:MAG: diguanylate cyclase [Bacillota bacterium]|nr:diguanylate cyclase [Bacillota bacterium]